MAKTIKEMQIIIRDTAAPGEPDFAEVYYKIVDGSLTKEENYEVSSPSFTKTVTQFWADEKEAIEDLEGI